MDNEFCPFVVSADDPQQKAIGKAFEPLAKLYGLDEQELKERAADAFAGEFSWSSPDDSREHRPLSEMKEAARKLVRRV